MEKQDLLLLHGALGSKDQFQNLIPLLEVDFEIYTLDFSGHGTTKPETEFGIITFANEVLDELIKWDIHKINVFGYSMGGYIATFLALHTNRINKAFTLGTKFLWTTEYADKETSKLDPEKILKKVPAFAEELKAKHLHLDWKILLEKTKQMMQDLGRFNVLPINELCNIDTPICVGIGDKDNTVSVEEAYNVYSVLQNSDLCVLPNTVHPLEKVNTLLLAEAIKQYFK
jgi:esterase/lipase